MTKLEEKAKQEEESAKPVFQMNQMSSGKADCKIRKNNYISCAAVQQQERMDNIKTGLCTKPSTWPCPLMPHASASDRPPMSRSKIILRSRIYIWFAIFRPGWCFSCCRYKIQKEGRHSIATVTSKEKHSQWPKPKG